MATLFDRVQRIVTSCVYRLKNCIAEGGNAAYTPPLSTPAQGIQPQWTKRRLAATRTPPN